MDAATFECTPVYSPTFVQKDVFRRATGYERNAEGIMIARPPRLSSRYGTYTDYNDTDDEAETRKWSALTDAEKDTWTAYRATNVPPLPRLHPASPYQPDYHANHAGNTRRVDPDFEIIRPFFGYAPADVVKNTFRATTQFARNVPSPLQVPVSGLECPTSQRTCGYGYCLL